MGIYEELGVKTVINASGPFTKVGGSLMPSEVVEAMAEASRAFVDIDELLEKAGERIAEIMGVEAAFVTSGAAAGLAVATAACMAGDDRVKAMQLPDTTGMKNEVIILRSHRIHYDQAIRVAGGRFVEVGFTDGTSADYLKAAITDKTAAIAYVAKREPASGSVPLEQVIELAHAADVPVIVDAADELPPVSNLHRFTDKGADLATFSGGKDIRGPQSSGLVLGRKDLIRACAVHACPNYGIGRAMKVGKEEIVGLVKAVELYVKQDFDEEMRIWEQQREYFVRELSSLPYVDVGVHKALPGEPGSFHLPAAYVNVNEEKLGMTKKEVIQQLKAGDTEIVVGESSKGIVLRAHMLKEGEERIIASRLKDILGGRQ
jgi:L-seryl-tRNA(Ser) seleniumtransferase